MGYRSRYEIILAILGSAGQGNTKTRIMRDAYLTYVQIMQYLSALERSDLIEHKGKVYSVTSRGRRVLERGMEAKKPLPDTKILEKLYGTPRSIHL